MQPELQPDSAQYAMYKRWENILKNQYIGHIDIDIGEIKSIIVDFYGIFTGLTYSIFKTNFVQLPL